MIVEIATSLIVLAIAGLAGALWRWRGSLPRLYREQREADAAMDREDAADELRALRERVVQIARTRNIVIAVSAKGTSPRVVTLSDGTTRYYFADHVSYGRAMRNRQVPPTRSFPGKPPVPVSRWTNEALRKWLADNAN